jgi:hypothetical protein
MKHLIYILFTVLLLISCEENSTEPKDDDKKAEVKQFKSHNIKTNGKHYFTFSTNSAVTAEPAEYDMVFGSVPLTVETAPCQFFTMPNDPLLLCGPNSSIAVVDAASLDDVTTIPSESEFKKDDTVGEAFLGKTWYDASNAVKPDVYVIKNCAGNYGLIQITNYDYDFTVHQITSIHFNYKYNADGSTDFSSTPVDSFKTANAYSEMKYFSFEIGNVSAAQTYQLKFNGSSIWLGENVEIKKLENTAIENITTVTETDFSSDTKKNYVTLGWYNYGEGHLLTPKDHVYVVKTSESKYAAVEIVNYYDDQGNSGTFTINWKYL